MSDSELFSFVTYDEEAEASYLYLSESYAQGKERSNETEEVHPDIYLDLNKEGQLIGVEFLAPTSEKMKYFAGKQDVFVKRNTVKGNGYFYSLVNPNFEGVSYGARWIKELPIVFLFEDEECDRFIGIDIFPEDDERLKKLAE